MIFRLVVLLVTLALAAPAAAQLYTGSFDERIAAHERVAAKLEAQAARLLEAPRAPSASGTAVPLYLGAGYDLPRFDERNRLNVRHLMLVELERNGVTYVDYESDQGSKRFAPPWQKAGFVIAPIEVMLAIREAVQPALLGTELDLRIATAERGVRFVTLVHELDGHLRVIDLAAAEPSPRAALDDAALRKRFGIGKLDGGEKPWSASERESLERALARLSKPELELIRDMELRRYQRPIRVLAAKGACGLAVRENLRRWIEIYDCAFRADDLMFAGDPRAPERYSVRLILHELAHAIAQAPTHEFFVSIDKLQRDVEATREKGAELESHRAGDLRPLIARLAAVIARMQAVVKRIAEARLDGPAVTAFSKVKGAETGITLYGRQSAAESFADAFSLFHADPEALRRVSPEAFEFFGQGKHL